MQILDFSKLEKIIQYNNLNKYVIIKYMKIHDTNTRFIIFINYKDS